MAEEAGVTTRRSPFGSLPWPCQSYPCSELGRNVIRIEYGEGEPAPHNIAIRLCDEHRDAFVDWFTDGASLRAERVQ